MMSPQGRNTWTVDDLVPYVEKITILSEEQDRITEPLSHGQFSAQQLNILQSSVETKGIAKRRETVEAKPYMTHRWQSVAMECITHHQHFISIRHGCISILSKVITLILLQANTRLVVLWKHILIFHGRL